MHYTKVFTIVALLAAGAFAAPAPEAAPGKAPPAPPPKPVKPQPPPPPPPGNTQSNTCGNDAAPYCCNTDNFGAYTTCALLGGNSQCTATTVCCNANNSIQICLGNAVIQ